MAKFKQAVRMGLKGCKLVFTQGPKAAWRLTKEKTQRMQACRQMEQIHLISPEERERQKNTTFANPVKFSILTPLYNTPESFLKELIASLQAQTYPNWELCLADGSDTEHAYVGQICCEMAEQDPRIVYSVLEKNGGISENTNACIALSSGEYFGLLDHDDVLHESALYEVMCAIEQKGADFIYTDEVKFDGNIEQANDFNFKPGFGKDELRSHNYICHFTCYSRALLESTGEYYRPAFDGSQDHDMVLRLTEKAKCIVHIPKVLYYWRVHSNSVSMGVDVKPYAVDAAIQAVSEQLQRVGEPGTVRSNLPYKTAYRITYEIDNPLVSILLYTVKNAEQAVQTIERLLERTSYRPLEFVVWQTLDLPEMKAPVRKATVRDRLSDSLDEMAKIASGEMLLLYDGAFVPQQPEWIEELLMFAQRPDVCAVGPKVYDLHDCVLDGGIALEGEEQNKIKAMFRGTHRDQQGYEAMLRFVRNVTILNEHCLMMKKQTWEALHGFAYAPEGYEVADFCLKGVKHGLWNVWTPFTQIKQQGTLHSEQLDTIAFELKWKDQIANGDEYYHPFWKKLGLI